MKSPFRLDSSNLSTSGEESENWSSYENEMAQPTTQYRNIISDTGSIDSKPNIFEQNKNLNNQSNSHKEDHHK